MAFNKTESWGFQSLAALLRDLGPREGERKVYKLVKDLCGRATGLSAGNRPTSGGHLERVRAATSSRNWPPGAYKRSLNLGRIVPSKNLLPDRINVTESFRKELCNYVHSDEDWYIHLQGWT